LLGCSLGCSMDTAPLAGRYSDAADAGATTRAARTATRTRTSDAGGPLHLTPLAPARDAGARAELDAAEPLGRVDAGELVADSGQRGAVDASEPDAGGDAGEPSGDAGRNDCGGTQPLPASPGVDCVHEYSGVCLRGDPHWTCTTPDTLKCLCP
jgi:hypothetical protein